MAESSFWKPMVLQKKHLYKEPDNQKKLLT